MASHFLSSSEIQIGIDEAGRGCLAGSVFAGAVILSPDTDLSRIQDSKKLSEERREEIFAKILSDHRCGIGFATVEEITKFNILNATFLAMKRAVIALKLKANEIEKCHLLVDGNQKIRGMEGFRQTPIVKGDQLEKAIAAASILAKVSRDREIRKLAEIYPAYGFAEHKGYGTELHRQKIAEIGPCEIHRPTFAGVKEHILV